MICVPSPQQAIRPDAARVQDVRILVADDNPVDQTVLVRMLKRLGYSPFVVTNGQQAVEAVTEASFDILFMDCEMPVLDGLAATREIRKLRDREHMPIIALSAHSPGEHKVLCLAAGMTDFVSKPVSLNALQEQLCRGLSCSEDSSIRPLRDPKHELDIVSA